MHPILTTCTILIIITIFSLSIRVECQNNNSSQCVLVNNQEPNTGSCNGPMDRVGLRQSNVAVLNGGCSNGQILFYVDGDTSNPSCGQCKPGTAGATDINRLCAIDQYCTDNATCADIRTHPFFNAPCPYDLRDDIGGFCGAGLTCYNHRCLPCLDGMVDYSDGKTCVLNIWTYNKWIMMINDPQSSILGVLLALLLLYAIVQVFIEMVLCCIKKISRDKKMKYLQGVKREVETAMKWAKGDDEEWEDEVLLPKPKANNIKSQVAANAENSNHNNNSNNQRNNSPALLPAVASTTATTPTRKLPTFQLNAQPNPVPPPHSLPIRSNFSSTSTSPAPSPYKLPNPNFPTPPTRKNIRGNIQRDEDEY